MDSLSNKVLITGINGFTGKYLSDYLQENGYVVFGTSHNSSENDDFMFQCDITDKQTLISILKEVKPNYIIHLAAISFVQHNDIQEIYNVNVVGTENLLEGCLAIKESLKKVILASSATVYGTQDQEILSENLCPNPVNHYGISKLAMEQIAKNYFPKLPILITRPFNYTAPGHGEQFVIPKIAKAFRNREKTLELGNLDVYREYNSVEFVCDIYLQLMKSEATSEMVNIASGETFSLNNILDLFSKKAQHFPEIKINPQFVRKDEIKKLAGDTHKLSTMVQIPMNYPIEKTIDNFLV